MSSSSDRTGILHGGDAKTQRRNGLSFKIRQARPEDADDLTRLAHAAKRYWNYPEEWIAAWRNDLTVRPRFIRSHPVYCAVSRRRIIGFYALSQRRTTFALEHMWVDPDFMGIGVGTALFRHVLTGVRARGGTALEIASDPNAETFYGKLGARLVGRIASTPAGRTLPLLRLDVPRRQSEVSKRGR